MLKNWIFLVTLFLSVRLFAQSTYYMELEPEVDFQLESVNRGFLSKNIKITSNLSEFSNFLNNQQVRKIEPAYPNASSPRLKQIFKLQFAKPLKSEAWLQRKEVRNISLEERPRYGEAFPNDYLDSDGNPETALQLIRAPQAWQITHGDSTRVYTGIVDRYFDVNHEELVGKLKHIIEMGRPTTNDHGTGVAVTLAGNTNNGKGFASIGYDTKLAVVTGSYPLIDGLDSLSKIPGIKIINTSWVYCQSSRQLKKLDTIIQKIRERGILVVAAAGNGKKHPCKLDETDKINGYHYPASYDLDNVISVTSVGNKYPYGHYDPDKYKKTGWIDCHQNNPFTDDPSLVNQHTHNDRVDITAPGLRIPVAYKGNKYVYNKWGTSEAAPYVAGTAALMLAVNPDLTAAQLKQILLETSDNIDHLPCNEPFIGKLGAGRLNAYRAVLTAECMARPEPGANLIIRSGLDDFGEEPYVGNNYNFDSPDIRIRQQKDGKIFQVKQNPLAKKGHRNYVYVHVTNTGCEVSSGKEQVNLYWAKTDQQLPWRQDQKPTTENGVQMSGRIGQQNIPPLGPGEETIVEIPWDTPLLKDFRSTESKDNSFYLMAEIDGTPSNDGSDWSSAADAVYNSNKHAWKKVIAEN